MATRNTTKTTKSEKEIETVASVDEEVVESQPKTTKKKTKVSTPKRREKLPSDMLVECQNLTAGKLIYISKRQNGYKIVWSNPGDVEEIELGELITMRNSQPKFFSKNWVGMDEEILRYLGVDTYYKNIPSFEDFDGVFELPLEEMQVALSNLPKGLHDTFAYKASELINSGAIDSVKTIRYLCEVFGLEIDN